MEHKISVKQILIDLLSIKEQVIKQFKSKERYKDLIAFIEAKDYYNDDELPYPTLKQIECETGLKTHQIRKQLKEIYQCFFDFEDCYTFNFNKIEIVFSVDYFKRFAWFKFNNISHIPRIGENITLPFLKAKVGTDYFYVESIRHRFECEKQIIEIGLNGGSFNSYWYYRKHKALEVGEIGIGEQYDLYEHEMKKRLGLRA